MSQPIEGKIVRILDHNNIVINKGRQDGVKEDMPFVIFVPCADEIIDPDTRESLGRLEIVKGYIEASHVQERITTCVARKSKGVEAEETGIRVQTLGGAMMAESMGARGGEWHQAREKMNVNTSQIAGVPHVGHISVGDSVRSMEKGI